MNLLDESIRSTSHDGSRGAAGDCFASLLGLYGTMFTSRVIDEFEAKLVSEGEAFFHVSAAGHEAIAVLHLFLDEHDWLHCHYRDKALMLARGVPPAMFFHSLLCNAGSHSAGRQMSAHMSDPARRILSLVGPVGNNALQAMGVAAEVPDEPSNPIVVCCVGDGTSQQGEFLEAIAEAVREQLPVLFIIEDNGLSISTTTAGRTFYHHPVGRRDEFHGLPIHYLDGRDPAACIAPCRSVVAHVRQHRGPALMVLRVDRLSNHTNADDQRVYREPAEIERAQADGDPVLNLRRHLIAQGGEEAGLSAMEARIRKRVRAAADRARAVEDPKPSRAARPDLPPAVAERKEYRGDPTQTNLTMLEALRRALHLRLTADPRATLFGQDIEDPKGDVFGVTRGLSTAFPGRVTNAPLSESTIVGKSIGRALAGGRPVAFLQFADFIPLAFNQIISELGSMHWRTNGGWRCPVIIMAPCGGYRPGLGPFHAQTMESILAHVPGIVVLMPSHATDAAGLLNAAFASNRPTVFLYPKVCLNDRDLTTPADVANQYVPIGRARHLQRGDDLTIVTYGSTILQCEKAAASLADHGVSTDLIDLRSIQPWDRDAVINSVRRTGRLLVVHEDNLSCSVASEILATVAESVDGGIEARRVTRPDVYVPCNFECQLETLPSSKRVLEAACDMLGLEVAWQPPIRADGQGVIIEARGGSPADQAVTVADWHVQVGDTVRVGDPLADLEADKAIFEFAAPQGGKVVELLAAPGAEIRIGAPLLRLDGSSTTARKKPATREEPGTPILTGRVRRRTAPTTPTRQTTISRPVAVQGGRVVPNEELAARFPGRTGADIERLTGIRSRRWVQDGQTGLSLAADAARLALDQHQLTLQDLGAIVVSTTTPIAASPSMACMLLRDLADGPDCQIPAHDVSAACTGYLYALTSAHDFIQANPGSIVLVATTEVLSPLLNLDDFDTAVVFGDAATATLLGVDDDKAIGRLHRPVLSAKADRRGALRVGLPGPCQSHEDYGDDGETSFTGQIAMDGKPVFGQAVRSMKAALLDVCRQADLQLDDLGLVVPHQANSRIIAAVADRLGAAPGQVLNAIAEVGNTSSSSIPLAMTKADLTPHRNIAFCAFGGGFTFGAAILEQQEDPTHA